MMARSKRTVCFPPEHTSLPLTQIHLRVHKLTSRIFLHDSPRQNGVLSAPRAHLALHTQHEPRPQLPAMARAHHSADRVPAGTSARARVESDNGTGARV